MESNSYLISPDSQYRQELRLVLNEEEISALHLYLSRMESDYPDAPEVAKYLRLELRYMLLEVREENAYLKQGGEP